MIFYFFDFMFNFIYLVNVELLGYFVLIWEEYGGYDKSFNFNNFLCFRVLKINILYGRKCFN